MSDISCNFNGAVSSHTNTDVFLSHHGQAIKSLLTSAMLHGALAASARHSLMGFNADLTVPPSQWRNESEETNTERVSEKLYLKCPPLASVGAVGYQIGK